MKGRYIRNLPALSEQECLRLREKRVLVVGCGGLGGYIAELLSRVGVGALRFVDPDCFEESNLNRQLLSAPALLGRSKAEIAAERIEYIASGISVEHFAVRLDESNADELLKGCDLVMDALDNVESRRILAKACEKAGLPMVYGAIAGWVAQAALSEPGDGFIDKLYPEDVEIRDKSALSFTPAFCASLQCAIAVRRLCGRKTEAGKLFCCDLLNFEFETIDLS